MAANASTWFYQEPEHRAYLIEERVNHTFWSNRIAGVYLDCTHEEPPFRMVGEWHAMPLELEWVPNDYLTLTTQPGDDTNLLLVGMKEMLGFNPTISYVNPEGEFVAQWYKKDVDEHIRAVQGNPNYHQIKSYR
jgi:hypothetical protein